MAYFFRIARWLGYALLALAAALFCVGLYGHLRSMGEKASFDLVEVEPGRRLHVVCEGPAQARPVIYDAGAFGVYADGWWIKEALKAEFRVCLYDRAGMGWSDPVPGGVSPDPAFHVADIRRLARATGLSAPFYLVGHSMAGARLHAFANLHPEEVAGLVFIDAVRPQAFSAAQAERVLKRFGGVMDLGVLAARGGLARLAAHFLPDALSLPGPPARDKRRSIASVRHHAASRAEVRAFALDADYLSGAAADRLPVSVLAASAGGGGNAVTAEAARAHAGFGRVHPQPEANHVSLLTPRYAAIIAQDLRDMEALRREREGPPV